MIHLAPEAVKDPFPRGDYYEGEKSNASGNGKDSASGVPGYRRAIEQAGGSRAILRSDQLLSQIRSIKEKYATKKSSAESKNHGEDQNRPD
ncbi:MAG: hypothetical protein ACOYOS_18200 [Syntrophales bacterium]